jgi:hypothetical protein
MTDVAIANIPRHFSKNSVNSLRHLFAPIIIPSNIASKYRKYDALYDPALKTELEYNEIIISRVENIVKCLIGFALFLIV